MYKNYLNNIVKLILLLSLIYCSNFNKTNLECYKYEGIPGPEDFVYVPEENILLISSHNRRDIDSIGEIFLFEIQTNQIHLLKRENEPENLSFRPHGIDYKKPYMYIILHGDSRNQDWHGIAIYEFKNHTLTFKKLFENSLITSPNDLIAINEKEILITNDQKVHRSITEILSFLFFGTKKGYINYCNIEKNFCEVVIDNLGFPNSLVIYKDKLYISATLENVIYEFILNNSNNTIKFSDKKKLYNILAPDNFIVYNNKIYITSHPSNWNFYKHSKNPENYSPSSGYEMDPDTNQLTKIFEDSGETISASSVIIKIQSNLFLGQVFDPFLLKCNL